MNVFQDLVTFVPWTFIFQICNLLLLAACILLVTAGVRYLLPLLAREIPAEGGKQIQTSRKGETE